MAGGTITFNADGVLQGKIDWSSSSNGSIENSSNVTAILYARRTDTFGPTMGRSWSGNVIANGTKTDISFSSSVSVSSSWVEMAKVTTVVEHDDDGSKSIDISGTVTGPTGTSLASRTSKGSETVKLDTIPRYATSNQSLNTKTLNTIRINWWSDSNCDYLWFSKDGGSSWTFVGSINSSSGTYTITGLTPNTTYNIKTRVRRTDSQLTTDSSNLNVTTFDIAKFSSVPNINIGASQNISWSNPSNATTTLKLCKTDNTEIINYGTVTGTSITVTPTANVIYPLTPNSNIYTARYIITTTQNNQSYTYSRDFTFTVTNSNPIFNDFEYEDINSITSSLTGNNQTLISRYSNVQAKISVDNKAVAQNYATMKSYKFVIGSKSSSKDFSSSADVTLNANNVDNSIMIMYATDSRGNSTSVTKVATLLNYEDLVITNAEVKRDNNGVGSNVTLTFEGTLWNNSFGAINNNIDSCKYYYRRTSSTDWIEGATTLTYDIKDNTFSGNVSIRGDLGANGFTVSETFYIRLEITDKLVTKTFDLTLGTGTPAIAIYKDKVAIGQKYDTSLGGSLQVNGTIYMDGLELLGYEIVDEW